MTFEIFTHTLSPLRELSLHLVRISSHLVHISSMANRCSTGPLRLLSVAFSLLELFTPVVTQTPATNPPAPVYGFLYPTQNGHSNLTFGSNDTLLISWQQSYSLNSTTTVQIQCWPRNATTMSLDTTGTFLESFIPNIEATHRLTTSPKKFSKVIPPF